jgi:ABC-type amino acid transport system permease subunit
MITPLTLNEVNGTLFEIFLVAGIVYFIIGVIAFLLGRWGPRP